MDRVLLLALLCSCSARALAQDGDAYGARARVVRPLAAQNQQDATAAGVEIDTRDREAAYESVDAVIAEAPGVHALRTGWHGSFTSASLRGAEAEHTAVLLSDIPLSSADAAVFDLSTIPVSLLDRVVVYRGGAPAWLSQGAVGGVIQLVPREAPEDLLEASATAGSLSTVSLRASAAITTDGGDGSWLASAGGFGTRGDFEYEDDRRTWASAGDDGPTRRANADVLDGHGLLHARRTLGPGRLELLALGFERNGGEPGAPADPAQLARRSFARGVLGVSYTIDPTPRRRLRLQALGAVSASRARFSDLYQEIGGRRARTDDVSTQLFGRLAGTALATELLDLTLVGTARGERFAPDDPFAPLPLPDSARTTLAATVEPSLHGRIAGHRVELRPSVRAERTSAKLHSERFGRLVTTDAAAAVPTYRVGLGLELGPDLTLSASASTGVRVPSVLELFGDGAFLIGNTALRPEHSRSYDLGLVDVTCIDDFAGSLELRVFDLSIDDQVVFVRNSFDQLTPRNLATSHVQGLEAGARTSYGRHLWLTFAATLLDTEGKPGRRLPNRPRAVVLAQPGVKTGRLGALGDLHLFTELRYTSSSFDDPDNQSTPKDPVLVFDSGLALLLLRGDAQLRVTASDLFDRGGADLRGFPLPGRTLLASFTYGSPP